MNVSESEARRLLAAVRETSERTHAAHTRMMEASVERAQAVRDALDAGIPRAQIAEAAGVRRAAIYRIAESSQE